MLKNILKLDGAQELSKNEQKAINGGLACGSYDGHCPSGSHCSVGPQNGVWNGRCILNGD